MDEFPDVSKYRLMGAVVPRFITSGFVTPFYQKVHGGSSYYVSSVDENNTITEFTPKLEVAYYSRVELRDLVLDYGVGDKEPVMVLCRDEFGNQKLIFANTVDNAYLKVWNLENTDYFSKAFLDEMHDRVSQFIPTIINPESIAEFLEDAVIDNENKWANVWNVLALAMYRKDDLDSGFWCCYDSTTDKNLKYLVVFLGKSFQLHVHRLDTHLPKHPMLMKSDFWDVSRRGNPWTSFLNKKLGETVF